MEASKSRKLCGAKTRQGTPCKRSPTLSGRCNLHGGKSLLGIAHPNYKHGYYSKYSLTRPLIQAARLRERIREKAARRVAKEIEQRRQKEARKSNRVEKNATEWDAEMLARIFQEMDNQADEANKG